MVIVSHFKHTQRSMIVWNQGPTLQPLNLAKQNSILLINKCIKMSINQKNNLFMTWPSHQAIAPWDETTA